MHEVVITRIQTPGGEQIIGPRDPIGVESRRSNVLEKLEGTESPFSPSVKNLLFMRGRGVSPLDPRTNPGHFLGTIISSKDGDPDALADLKAWKKMEDLDSEMSDKIARAIEQSPPST